VSLLNRATPPSPGPPPPVGLEGAIDRAATFLGPYLAGLVGKSAPTPQVLKALADELTRAASGKSGIAHPELLDPDVYWSKTAWPQAAAIVKHARRALIEVADELDAPVRATEKALEQWLRDEVAASGATRAADAGAVRRDVIDAIVLRCQELHRVVERLTTVLPGRAAVAVAREQLDRRIGGDEALRAETPYRHQELLVHAYELALDAIDEDVTAMVLELTEPILGIGERLVRRYDDLVAEFDAADAWSAAEASSTDQ
jgi:hypothetical protein